MEIKELAEEVKSLVGKMQSEVDTLAGEGRKTSDTLQNIEKKFAETVEKFEAVSSELESEKKAREDLERSIARIGVTDKDGAKMFSDPEYKAAFAKAMREQTTPKGVLSDAEVKGYAEKLGLSTSPEAIAELKTAFSGSNPDGGYVVPVDMYGTIENRVRETSVLRQLATIYNTGTNLVKVIGRDEFGTSQNVAEIDTMSKDSTRKYYEVEIPINKVAAYVAISTELLQDAFFNFEGQLSADIADDISVRENTNFITGDGVKKAKGILSYDAWAAAGQYERNKLESPETASSNAIAADDLIGLQALLMEKYQSNANWLMHRLIWTKIIQLKDKEDNYLINPMMLFSGVSQMQLLGRPVRMCSDMPSGLADADLAVAYGDFKAGYIIADRIGLSILRDPYTAKDDGVVEFLATKRVGGAVKNFQAIKRLKIKA